MNPIFFIVVDVPENRKWTNYYMQQWASRLYEKGIDIKINFVKGEILTPMVRCRFMSESDGHEKWCGLRADEVFGMSEYYISMYRKNGLEGRFAGNFMDYILLMNQGKVVEEVLQ